MQSQSLPLTNIFESGCLLVSQGAVAYSLFTDGRRKLPRSAFLSLACLLALLWLVIGYANLLEHRSMYTVLRTLPWYALALPKAVATIWVFTSGAAALIYLVFRNFSRRVDFTHSPERRSLIQAAGVVAVAAPFAITAFGAFVERTNYHVKEIDLPIPNLHPDLDGLRIVQLSDLHVSPYLSVREAARVVDMANELKAHLTVVTGDLISYPGDPLVETIREIGRLRADLGVLGCLGNHETYAQVEGFTTAESARYGVDFLRHRQRILHWGNAEFNVAGVDYQPFNKKDSYLAGTETLIRPGMPNLLLSHNPDVFPAAVDKGFDSVLAGHTHGGQVTVEIWKQTVNLARFFTPYVAGLYRLNGRSCYVTAGIGTIGMPVRIGARPEITLARLRRA